MNVTLVPEQIDVELAEMLTAASCEGVTVMVTGFEVAGLPLAQAELEVITQVITLLLTSALLE